jgi:shikimate dehydrogenase
LAWGDDLPTGLGVIVQATSAGMKGTSGGEELAARLPWARLSPLVAYDLVYNPPTTPFLRAAAEHGHWARGGLGMLVGQAARAIEIWWGVRPPSAPLERAARQALGLV